MPNITQIPALRVPLIDEKTGLMSREWYRFFVNIFQLTGEGSNTESLSDLQVGPPPIDFAAVNSVFTASTAGLAPASGGGTVNFLRADGTFAAPAPAGSTTEIQFNSAGAFGASSNFTYNTGTNTVSFGNITGSATSMTIQPKAPTSGGGGLLEILTRNAVGSNSSGGDLTLTLGSGNGTGSGGSFSLATGSLGADSGAVFIINGATPGLGGTVVVGSGYAGTGAGGDYQFYLGGGFTDDGNMYFQDSASNNFIHCKTASPGGALQMGFFNSTPVAQAAAYTKTYSTASRTIPVATFTNLATTAATNVGPYGFSTAAQADDIAIKTNALAADVLILKQLIVSLVNDSSTTLGVGLNAT